MNLIAPPQLSPAQEALLTMQALLSDTFTTMATNAAAGFELFWQNPNAAPQEMADALGPNAARVFECYGDVLALVQKYAPEKLAGLNLAPPQAYTFNETGELIFF